MSSHRLKPSPIAYLYLYGAAGCLTSAILLCFSRLGRDQLKSQYWTVCNRPSTCFVSLAVFWPFALLALAVSLATDLRRRCSAQAVATLPMHNLQQSKTTVDTKPEQEGLPVPPPILRSASTSTGEPADNAARPRHVT
jgi:hypothetical protein